MFWRKKHRERLPWYRARAYKGKMSEKEKRELDAFRLGSDHPADCYDSLPDHVQSYINKLECDLHEIKRSFLTLVTIFTSGLGGYALYSLVNGYETASAVMYTIGFGLLVVPWVFFYKASKKLSESYLSATDPGWSTREALREEWDIDHVSVMRRRERELSEP